MMASNIVSKSNKICITKGCDLSAHGLGYCNKHYQRFIKRGHTNLTKRLVHSIGVNDSNYYVFNKVNGNATLCPYYEAWNSMLRRCYSNEYHEKQPSYIDCTVCNEWLYFMTFRAWMIKEDWMNKELDKDIIIPGNRVYSPETCCFVDKSVNALIVNNLSMRGEYPLGVYKRMDSGKFVAKFSIKNKRFHIGCFSTVEEAQKAYGKAKSEHIRKIAKTQPSNIQSGLLRHAKLIKNGEIK